MDCNLVMMKFVLPPSVLLLSEVLNMMKADKSKVTAEHDMLSKLGAKLCPGCGYVVKSDQRYCSECWQEVLFRASAHVYETS